MADPESSTLGMQTPYAPRVMVGAWVAAGWAGIAYGVFLTITALRSPPGAELTGQWFAQPAFKASMALLLALAAAAHPVVRERRWLMLALLFSAVGDALLAIPWWAPSFVLGLALISVGALVFSRCAAASGARVAAVGSVADPLDRRGVDVRGVRGAAGVVLAAAGS